MALNISNSTDESKHSMVCPVNNYLAFESTNSSAEELIWLIVAFITTTFNLVTAVRIMKRRPKRLFDVCLLNYIAVYLMHGNILFISMGLYSAHGENCSFVTVIVVAFLMLSFTKLIIFIVINANQLHTVRGLRIINAQHSQALKTTKMLFFLSSTWMLSAVLVAISLLSGFDVFPIVVIAGFGMLTLILRVCTLLSLWQVGDVSNTMAHTLSSIKKSVRMLSLLIFIEVCAWLPIVVASLIYNYCSKRAELLHVVNWCLKILFLFPIFYVYATEARNTSLQLIPNCCKVEAETAQSKEETNAGH